MVCHSAYTDERLEVPGHDLRSVVADDPGTLTGILLASPLDDRLHLGFLHGLADLPVNDESAVAVEDAAQKKRGPADVVCGFPGITTCFFSTSILHGAMLSKAGRFTRRESTGSNKPTSAPRDCVVDLA
jgi:hypothetical protein